MTLSDAEKRSPLWHALAEHYTARLASLRAQNDADKSPDQTAKLRGQILEVKAFLSLADEPRTPVT